MNVAIKHGAIPSENDFEAEVIKFVQKFVKKYPNAGYGISFMDWIENPKPYNSLGNSSHVRELPPLIEVAAS